MRGVRQEAAAARRAGQGGRALTGQQGPTWREIQRQAEEWREGSPWRVADLERSRRAIRMGRGMARAAVGIAAAAEAAEPEGGAIDMGRVEVGRL